MIEFRQSAPGEYTARLMIEGETDRLLPLRGDEWQMDARVVTWKPPATILGLDPIYQLESWPALVMSNAVYAAEILTGILLLIPPLRPLGFALGLGSIIGIEAVAREFMFGSLVLSLLMIYRSAAWSRAAFWAGVMIYAAVLLVRLDVLSGWVN